MANAYNYLLSESLLDSAGGWEAEYAVSLGWMAKHFFAVK